MRFRWPRFLPGFPAVLLMPAILAAWAILCSIPRYSVTDPWFPRQGFPLAYWTTWDDPGSVHDFFGFRASRFVFDLGFALAVSWLFALAIDRLVFPAIRAARRGKRGTGEVG